MFLPSGIRHGECNDLTFLALLGCDSWDSCAPDLLVARRLVLLSPDGFFLLSAITIFSKISSKLLIFFPLST